MWGSRWSENLKRRSWMKFWVGFGIVLASIDDERMKKVLK
jgi:hypothetical protein